MMRLGVLQKKGKEVKGISNRFLAKERLGACISVVEGPRARLLMFGRVVK